MLRHVLAVVCVVALVFGLVGCAEEKQPATQPKPKTPTSAAKQKPSTKQAQKPAGEAKKAAEETKKAAEETKK